MVLKLGFKGSSVWYSISMMLQKTKKIQEWCDTVIYIAWGERRKNKGKYDGEKETEGGEWVI